jgi:F0F1-type ATP synthase beta subunit
VHRDGGVRCGGESGQRGGWITAIRGSVVEAWFLDCLPAINEALNVAGGSRTVVLEVAHHLDPETLRAIAMAPTESLSAE